MVTVNFGQCSFSRSVIGMGEKKSETPFAGIRRPRSGAEIGRFKEYVRGSNPRIPSSGVMIKTSPPGAGSRLITITEQNS